MILKNNLIRGTLILTISGLLSRLLGFFYRVFLSRAIGAEGMGLYQLIFPVYMLSYGITVSGIQTAISRMVSARTANGQWKSARRILFLGICLSLSLSVPVAGFFLFFPDFTANFFLKNASTASLLRIMALAIPFGSFHACVDGYFLGIRKPSVPAIRQLLEQCTRFVVLFPLYYGLFSPNIKISPVTAVVILVTEESVSAIFSLCAMIIDIVIPYFSQKSHSLSSFSKSNLLSDQKELISIALPLTGNRILVCILQSMEAGLLPVLLQYSGYSSAKSIQIYGILTGMALPMILFPTAVTSSLSSMLLPAVSAAQMQKSKAQIRRLIQKSSLSCIGIGLLFALFFLFFGHPLTTFLFQNTLAGYYVQSFAFICPLLYLNPVLFSILNGLGKSSDVFWYNLISLIFRLGFILLSVPALGISGYFTGLFFSQMLCFFLCSQSIRKAVIP